MLELSREQRAIYRRNAARLAIAAAFPERLLEDWAATGRVSGRGTADASNKDAPTPLPVIPPGAGAEGGAVWGSANWPTNRDRKDRRKPAVAPITEGDWVAGCNRTESASHLAAITTSSRR